MGTMGAEMKVLTLEIEVKSIEFAPDELRIQGVNQRENDFVKLGAYHTLTVHYFPPQEVTVKKKEWDDIAEDRLQEACNQDSKADTVALLMAFGEAQLLLVTPSLFYEKAKIEVTIAKKHKNDGSARDKSIARFFKQVLDAVLNHVDMEKTKVLLICSPGHVREEFLEYIKETGQRAELGPLHTLYVNLSKVVLVKVSSNTIGGLREAFADPTVSAKMESTRCASDIRVWQTFQDTMNNDPDRCVYTPQFVYQAALAGAVGTLMVSDEVFRSPNPVERHLFLALVHFAKNANAAVHVFSSNHVTGEQLTQLGRIAAILNFPCSEIDDIDIVENFIESEEAAQFIRNNASSKVTV